MSKSKMKMNKNEALICVVLCLFAGCIFVFTNLNWNDTIEKEDVVSLTARIYLQLDKLSNFCLGIILYVLSAFFAAYSFGKKRNHT